MFFRNLFLFRFAASVSLDLAKALPDHQLKAVGPMELTSTGFVPPLGVDDEFVHVVGDYQLVALGIEQRLLPNAVIEKELRQRLEQVEAHDGKRAGSKTRKRIKDEIITDFLPRAFVQESRITAYLDAKDGWLVVNTGSRKQAELLVTKLRIALGTFPCTPMAAEESPRALMTDWVIRGRTPSGVMLGDSIELRDPVESGAIVRCTRQDLETDEVREHLKCGKQVFKLAVTALADRISFTIDDDLTIRKVKLHDGVLEGFYAEPYENAYDEATASFFLQAALFSELLEWLAKTFGIAEVQNQKLKLDGGDAPKSMRKANAASAAAQNFVDTVRKGGASVTISGAGIEPLHISRKDISEVDELFTKALDHVRAVRRVSVTNVQRTFQVGYIRAARIVEQLEQHGHVSAADSAGQRTVL
jgi:recombination associated protein RdgC